MRKLLILLPTFIIVLCVGAGVWYIRFINSFPTSADMDTVSAPPPITSCPVSNSFPGLSREVSKIAKGKSGYFEKDTFAGSYETRDDFVNDWYGKPLTAMKEPSLLDPVDDDKEIYRFLWLRSFDHPMAVRIERSLTDTKLIFTETSGDRDREPETIIRHEEKSIDDSQWCRFLTLMDQAGYWNLGEDREGGAQDGAQWIVEGVREGRYHLVDRQSPEGGEYRAACLYLLEIAGVDPRKSGRGIY